MEPFRLLFVCQANVCRSPFMAATFVTAGALAGRIDGWEVRSAGVKAHRDKPMCDVAVSLLTDQAMATHAAGHRAVQITPAHVESSDLIITASTVERGEVGLLVPAARGRVFTVREALDLHTPTATMAAGGEYRNALAQYAAELHARRGLVPQRKGLFGRDVGVDSPDVHNRGMRAHRAGIGVLRTDVERFWESVNEFLGSRG